MRTNAVTCPPDTSPHSASIVQRSIATRVLSRKKIYKKGYCGVAGNRSEAPAASTGEPPTRHGSEATRTGPRSWGLLFIALLGAAVLAVGVVSSWLL